MRRRSLDGGGAYEVRFLRGFLSLSALGINLDPALHFGNLLAIIDLVPATELFLSSLEAPPGWFDDATRSPKRRGRPGARSRPGSLPPLAHSQTVLLGWRATIKTLRVQSFCLGVRVSVCGASLASSELHKCRAVHTCLLI